VSEGQNINAIYNFDVNLLQDEQDDDVGRKGIKNNDSKNKNGSSVDISWQLDGAKSSDFCYMNYYLIKYMENYKNETMTNCAFIKVNPFRFYEEICQLFVENYVDKLEDITQNGTCQPDRTHLVHTNDIDCSNRTINVGSMSFIYRCHLNLIGILKFNRVYSFSMKPLSINKRYKYETTHLNKKVITNVTTPTKSIHLTGHLWLQMHTANQRILNLILAPIDESRGEIVNSYIFMIKLKTNVFSVDLFNFKNGSTIVDQQYLSSITTSQSLNDTKCDKSQTKPNEICFLAQFTQTDETKVNFNNTNVFIIGDRNIHDSNLANMIEIINDGFNLTKIQTDFIEENSYYQVFIIFKVGTNPQHESNERGSK
jgi:hypothetical protein